MKTKNITYSAIFSAIFVLLSMVVISTGIGYTVFLDLIVPIYICIVYLKMDRKYAFLMGLTSLMLVFFTLGNAVAAIWMAQGMIIGFICTIFISKKSSIFDDFLYSSILASFVIILVDIYFSAITGYSLIKESEEMLQTMMTMMKSYNPKIVFPEYYSSLVLYVSVATIPVGTVIVVYLGSMIMGSKLKILDDNSKRKYNLIKGFKKYGTLLCCSKEAYSFSIIYVIIVEIIKALNINIAMTYLRVVIMSIEVICFYFIVKDSLSFFMKYILISKKSAVVYKIAMIFTLYFLCIKFRLTTSVLVILSYIINKKMNLRSKQLTVLEKKIAI